jgi:hypothetical protein
VRPSLVDTWRGEAKSLRESIAPVLLVRIDPEWYGGPVQTPTVHAGLLCSSRVVYEAAAAAHASSRTADAAGEPEDSVQGT